MMRNEQNYYTAAISATERRMLQADPQSDVFTALNNLRTKLILQQKNAALFRQRKERQNLRNPDSSC